MGASELSALLWQERELLDVLEYRLDVEKALLASGSTRWLQRASDDVASVVAQLRKLNLVRDIEVAEVATEWQAAEAVPNLRAIIDVAPEGGPWADIFTSHMTAMMASVARIGQARAENDRMLRAAIRSTQETLAGYGDQAGVYTAQGTAAAAAPSARLFEKDA